ncbi:MAG: polysaccharide biosynthesis/export family protein [Candidatus Cryptobacteroides sp.]
MKHSSIIARFFVAGAVLMAAVSCSTYKNINYMQDLQADKETKMEINKGILIQPKDLISIIISSRSPEIASMFNLPIVAIQPANSSTFTTSQSLLGYSVDNDGCITFPILGKIYVAGMNRWELAEKIKGMLVESDLVKDPVVTVSFMNFKVSVMGEVSAPGTYTIDGDKITILEALSLARDLTIFGRRDNVAVIREQNGVRTTFQVDLRSTDLFNSPAYYLQQNDIVYVTPNKVKAGQSTVNENTTKSASFWVSVGSFLTTVATLIATLATRGSNN